MDGPFGASAPELRMRDRHPPVRHPDRQDPASRGVQLPPGRTTDGDAVDALQGVAGRADQRAVALDLEEYALGEPAGNAARILPLRKGVSSVLHAEPRRLGGTAPETLVPACDVALARSRRGAQGGRRSLKAGSELS